MNKLFRKLLFTFLLFVQIVVFAASTKVIIHYQPSENLEWDLWVWPDKGNGNAYAFDKEDEYGKYAEITLDGEHKKVGYIVRLSDWSKKDVGEDRFIDIEDGEAEIWVKSQDATTYYSNPDKAPLVFDNVNLDISYYPVEKDANKYRVKVWAEGQKPKYIKLVQDGEKFVAKGNYEGKEITKLNFEITKRWWFFFEKKVDVAREITKIDESGNVNIFINQEDKTIYKSEESATKPKAIESASIDAMNAITVKTNKNFNLEKEIARGITASYDNKVKEIVSLTEDAVQTNIFKIVFDKDLDLKNKDGKINMATFGESKVNLGSVVRDKSFDDYYAYDGELGAIYTKEETTIKVWAPTADFVNLLTYEGDKVTKEAMTLGDKGVYSITLSGDKLGLVYQFEVGVNGEVNVTNDPYTYSTTANGEKSVVVNPTISEVANPSLEDVIIYELHVRDLSVHPGSGILNKGKFLGLTETGTKTASGQITGLDYIKSLGITHVQLLPIYDFSSYSVDETDQFARYNWGYDPVNYNTVEGSYATNPYDPNVRIQELQKTVDVLHQNNLGVIMDVVYNHVFSAGEHAFNKIVPGYYYRYDGDGNLTNGTGVGNDVASERKMVKKFIIDSAKYWAKTFKLDGFRFDLMGILDVETMNELRYEMKKINPNFFILGEGWDMGTLDPEMKASQNNANKLEGIAFFNDDFRDAVKGSTFGEIGKGFVSGNLKQEERLFASIKGGEGMRTYTSPMQLIQYIEAHDNLTLFDQISRTNDTEDLATITRRHNLGTTIVLLSQGVPFIHAGQEFLRTKGGDENSYKSSDEVNRLDWELARRNSASIDLVRELIKIRKSNPDFNLKTFEEVNKTIKPIKVMDQIIAYTQADKVIIFNASGKDKEVQVENGKYIVLVKANKAKAEGLEELEVKDGKVVVPMQSALVLKKK
ncbi:type I pullulanase [Streptobacillus felis]|uniref:pullulanase n=1 Tax=Streptobacillus felis TaxID=1384509 RepID=A0A7Z0PGP1_9FUSO|nr:type I pullulanase [Streptobacillus felis]NYV28232.1 type I pullulanase [Streptobacillus felis]